MRTRILAFVAGAAAASFAIATPSAHVGRAAEPDLFLRPHPIVVLADRPVCSLLSGPKRGAGITGQDSSHIVQIDDTVYWTFGDTTLDGGGMLPNSIGWTTDTDASDCLSLTPKTIAGRVAPLLPVAPGELTVWPMGMAQTAPGQVDFFYASVVADPQFGYRVAGVGLAAFDIKTLTARRLLGGTLPWRDGVPGPGRIYADQEYVYIFSSASRQPRTTDTILARVAKNAMESLSDYEYWDPGKERWIGGLWDEASGSWSPALNDIGELWRQPNMHNGIDVAYNPFLGRWLAVYTTDFTSVGVRAADAITGPWDQEETTLVDCFRFHPAPQTFRCYSASQYAMYAKDSGRTIYVSYSNSETYQIYLHEIRLAAPVRQWTGDAGDAVLVAGAATAPDGYTEDGISFYASDIPVPGFAAIHGWDRGGAIRYGPSIPGPASRDLGIAFYAPADVSAANATNTLYAPVYRWTLGQIERYSPLDLARSGYSQQEMAFYGACPDGDGDKLSDCAESFLGTDTTARDTDGDGLDDGLEVNVYLSNPLNPDTDRDGLSDGSEVNVYLSNPLDPDTDKDGCYDGQEAGPDRGLGGGRDPTNFWDFYDTPDANGVRDGKIMMNDILQVMRRYGVNDAAGRAPINRTSSPFGVPPPLPAYSSAFDRSPPSGAFRGVGPPDGRIAMFDVLRVMAQYGNSCVRAGS